MTEEIRDPQTGQYVKGHKGGPGRPKGSRNKLEAKFYDDLYGDWKQNGLEAIQKMREKTPGDYVKVVASQMPKKHELDRAPIDDLSDAQLADLIDTVRELVSASPTEEAGSGEAAETRH